MAQNNAMNDIMSRDEKIDSLTDAEVRDVWARYHLMTSIMECRSDNFHPENGEDFPFYEDQLIHGDGPDIRIVAKRAGLDPSLVRRFTWDRGTDNVEKYIKVVAYDVPGNVTAMARDSLKRTCNGSLGMPDDSVARKRIEYLRDNPELAGVRDE